MRNFIWLILIVLFGSRPGIIMAQEAEGNHENIKEVIFETAGFRKNELLHGHLILPELTGKFPLIILAGNTGLLDDKSVKTEKKLFHSLAGGLNNSGYAVAWIEFAASGEESVSDLAMNIRYALEYLLRQSDIDSTRTGIIGFDEGSVIALIAAGKLLNPNWLILLSAPVLKGNETLIQRQLQVSKGESGQNLTSENSGKMLENIHVVLKKNSDDSLAARKIRRLNPGFTSDQLRYYTSNWYRTFFMLNPEEYLKRVHCPVLALYGADDHITDPKQNAESIEKAFIFGGNSNYTINEIPAMDHYFEKTTTGIDQAKSIPEVLEEEPFSSIIKWLSNH